METEGDGVALDIGKFDNPTVTEPEQNPFQRGKKDQLSQVA